MSAQVRVLKQKIKATQSIQKMVKAQELIATSRIAKAQAKVQAAAPYSTQITDVLTALASASNLDHPLLTERANPQREGILLITSDRGLCGGFNANAIKASEELAALVRSSGRVPVMFIVGRKGLAYYTFRRREVAASWTGFSEKPTYADAAMIAARLLPTFAAGSANEFTLDDGTTLPGIDTLHVVSTRFVSMISQVPQARRVAPMEVEYVGTDAPGGPLPAYEFEPVPEALMDALLPKYVTTRIYAALLDSAASESAARRAACKNATDNASDIIRNYSRLANQARQAQITQELSEIVGGADALAASAHDED
jgi:F-type H+-transporting ATPase subunit gamma